MAINIDTLVHNEFGRSATDQLEKIIGKPSGQVQSGVERAITEVLDGFSVTAREESGRQSIYEAARYCDDGLIDDPAVFFGVKDERAAIADSNNALGGLVGIAKRDHIAEAVKSASGLSAADADTITGYVTPGVLGVMKRQMLNGAVLDNSDGIGQMLLGETTTASVGGAGASVDHSVPKTAPRQTQTTHIDSSGGASAAARTSSAGTASGTSAASTAGSGAAVAHKDGADLSWLFRWMLPALLLGGLVLAGLRNCGVAPVDPVAVVDPNVEKLSLVQGEVDGLKGQITTLTAERDEALSDRETAVAEIDRLQGEIDNAAAVPVDTSALDAANEEITSLKAELAKPADTSDLDAANAEIASLKEELAKPADTSELDAANAEIASLKEELAKPTDNSALDAAKAEIASLKEELAKPADTSALDAANAEIAGLRTQLANVPAPVDNSAEIMGLRKNIDDGTLRVAQLESELGTVRTSRDELEASMALMSAEKTGAEERTAELKEKLLTVAGAKNRLDAQIGGLQKSVADGEAANAEKQTAIDDLTAQLEAGSAEQEQLQTEVTRLTTELDLVRSKRDELAESVASLTAERDSALGEVEQGAAKIAALDTDITSANDALAQQQADAAALEAERDGALSKIDILQANLDRAVDDASNKRKAAVASRSEVIALQKLVTQGKASGAELQKANQDLEAELQRANEDLDYAGASLAELEGKLKAGVGERKSLAATVAANDAEIARLAKGRSWAMQSAAKKTDKLRAVEAELMALKGTSEETDAMLAKVTKGRSAAMKTVTDLAGKLRTSESELAALKGSMEETNSKLAMVTEGRSTAMNRATDLFAKLRSAEKERDALAGDKAGLERSIADAEAAMQAQKDRVTGVSASLADRLNAAGLDVSVSPIEDNQAVGITMGSSDLYSVGSATLSPQGSEMLDAVGSIVSEYDDWRIDVEGHTDGQPIGGALRAKYESNWELSVARAAAAVRYLQFKTGIPAEKMSVRGFGEHRPVDTNETREGREANRRIELILRN